MPDSVNAWQMINSLPCAVELPPEWDTFFDKRGALPTIPADERHSPRYYLRSAASLEFQREIPSLPRPKQALRVMIKDISQLGLAILHSEALYPLERLRITFLDGAQHIVDAEP